MQVGYAGTTLLEDENMFHKPVIGFDMGGTSTDVSRYHGNYEHVFETTIAGISIQAPQVCDKVHIFISNCPFVYLSLISIQ